MSAIQDLLDDLGVRYATSGKHVTQGWVGMPCMWCDNGQGNNGLGINLSNGAVSCWSCGGRSLASVLFEATRRPWAECKRLADSVRTSYRAAVDETAERRGKLAMPTAASPTEGRRHKEYLVGRGFLCDAVRRLWNLHFTGQVSNHPWRIVWPLSVYGRVVSWTSRGIGTEGYRAADPSEEVLHLKHNVLGRDAVRHSVVICEGPFDCMAVGPGAVCTFGVGYTQSQVNRLAEIPVRYVCFDQDAAGWRAATKLADDLAPLGGVTKVVELDAADPGSASRRELSRLRRLAFGKGDLGSPGRV